MEMLWGRFKTHAYRPHSHAGYVIAVVTDGVEEVNCRGVLNRAGPGDILFINPEEIHDGQRGADGGWQYRVFYPTVSTLSALASSRGAAAATLHFSATVVHAPVLARRLAALHARSESAPPGLEVQSGWLSLLAELVDRYAGGAQLEPRARQHSARLRRVRDLIEAAYEQPLSLERLAAEAELSPFHLLRSFKAEFGMSPHAYLIAVRARRSKALLETGTPAAAAAAAVGFADQSHFIRHFKSAYGVTPGQYAAARGRQT